MFKLTTVSFLLLSSLIVITNAKTLTLESIRNELEESEARPRYGSIFKRHRRETTATDNDETNKSSSSMEFDKMSEAEFSVLAKFFMSLVWEANKAETLGGFLEEISDSDSNITVVGWQHIYDTDGSVKEIKTLEFVVPPMPDDDDTGNFQKDDDSEEEEEATDFEGRMIPHSQLKTMKELMKLFSLAGISVSTTYELYKKDGEFIGKMYLDKDELLVDTADFVIYNKTVEASDSEIKSFLKSIEGKGFGKPTVIIADGEGKLLDVSSVNPILVGGVVDYYEPTEDMFIKGPEIMADVWAKYHDSEIPEKLAKRFNKEFPEYHWRTIVNPNNFYVIRDVSITLNTDNLEFWESGYDQYMVYGKKH